MKKTARRNTRARAFLAPVSSPMLDKKICQHSLIYFNNRHIYFEGSLAEANNLTYCSKIATLTSLAACLILLSNVAMGQSFLMARSR